MALIVPQVADDRNPAVPIQNAYGWNCFLALDLVTGQGKFVISFHPDANAWQARPISTIEIALGQKFGDLTFPTLAELMADDGFRLDFNAIGAKLYAEAVRVVPALAGATLTAD